MANEEKSGDSAADLAADVRHLVPTALDTILAVMIGTVGLKK